MSSYSREIERRLSPSRKKVERWLQSLCEIGMTVSRLIRDTFLWCCDIVFSVIYFSFVKYSLVLKGKHSVHVSHYCWCFTGKMWHSFHIMRVIGRYICLQCKGSEKMLPRPDLTSCFFNVTFCVRPHCFVSLLIPEAISFTWSTREAYRQ